jgi:hypothetical protein
MSMTSADAVNSHAVSPAESVEADVAAASWAVAVGRRRRMDRGEATAVRIRRTCILAVSKPRLD